MTRSLLCGPEQQDNITETCQEKDIFHLLAHLPLERQFREGRRENLGFVHSCRPVPRTLPGTQ